ncbi:MAG: hypothetical protein H6Q67_1614 [Firmicutes bacterium]|nr:hypothetical protein [Bacillota bacterium]
MSKKVAYDPEAVKPRALVHKAGIGTSNAQIIVEKWSAKNFLVGENEK